MSVEWIHRVLERDLDTWKEMGWREVARDRIQSLPNEDIVVIVWDGAEGSEPKCPARDPDRSDAVACTRLEGR